MAAGGAIGGFLTYLLMNPSLSASELRGRQSYGSVSEAISDIVIGVALLGLALGVCVGVCLILAEEAPSRSLGRILRKALLGATVGAVFGTVGSLIAQFLFLLLLAGRHPSEEGGVSPTLIVARTAGWAVIGVAAGICPGVASRSGLRIRQGVIGGLLGGGLGGFLFDSLGTITQGGSVSRFVGFVLIGAAVGALVSLIEEFGKEYWLTAMTGAREGRAFILAKSQTWLGRDELADIPLFGDPAIQKRHALLTLANNAVTVTASAGAFLTVNNQPVGGSPLSEGDILGIGRHLFRFHSRRAVGPKPQLPPRDGGIGNATPAYIPPEPALSAALPSLRVLAGPHTGETFPLISGAIIGRDPRCDIALTRDMRASRQHARLLFEGTHWRIEDGGSANGLWVNGQRVVNQELASGDQIGVGDSLLQVI